MEARFYRRRAKVVEARWKEFCAPLTYFVRLYQVGSLEQLRKVFYRRIQYLLEEGVRWKAIRDRRMDWPLISDEFFLKQIKDFRLRSARYGSHLRHPSHPNRRYGQDFEKRYANDHNYKEIS